MTQSPVKYVTVNDVCEMLNISRRTLHRMVYERRCIQAYNAPGAITGRLKNGKRRPNKLLFKMDDIVKMLKPVMPDSAREMKRKGRSHTAG